MSLTNSKIDLFIASYSWIWIPSEAFGSKKARWTIKSKPFEDLTSTAAEDEEEEDELANVPKEKKTKHGYLKDGFVVDSSETEDELTVSNSEDELEEDEEDEEEEEEDDLVIEDIGSELSEESYDYDSDNKEK